MTVRARRRRAHDRRGVTRPPIDDELARGVDVDDYDWKLARIYAGIARDAEPDRARWALQRARENDELMWTRFPGGPASVEKLLLERMT